MSKSQREISHYVVKSSVYEDFIIEELDVQ